MKRRDLIKRTGALLLTLMMTLSMCGSAFEAVWADDGEAAADSTVTSESVETEQSNAEEAGQSNDASSGGQDVVPADSADQTAGADGQSSDDRNETAVQGEPDQTVEPVDVQAEDQEEPAAVKSAAEDIVEEGAGDESGDTGDEDPAELGVIENLKAVPDGAGKASLTWDAFEGAVSYIAYAEKDGKTAVQVSAADAACELTGLDGLYELHVEALDADGIIIAASDKVAVVTFNQNFRKAISSRTIKSPSKLTAGGSAINLRKMIGQGHAGYAVVQGACTDGTYAYYLMVSSYTQKGIVAKVRMSDNKLIKKSAILNVSHGNGMTYDSKRHLLVVNSREERRQELTCIDADALTITRQANVKYSYYNGKNGTYTASQKSYGIAAVAYSERYDCYLALMRNDHEIMMFDPDTFQAIGLALTKINAKYPGVYQAMDADDRYVYLLLSSDGKNQSSNLIITLDWNSEKLLPVANGEEKYVKSAWKCNNSGDGSPDAVIKLGTSHEAESIFHTAAADGREHFYLTEYYNNPQYKWVDKKVAYKVKWKKVTKRVKWKKVKGKWKYKKKKVWKYKTKYKTVMTKVVSHYMRDNYVFDLGSF